MIRPERLRELENLYSRAEHAIEGFCKDHHLLLEKYLKESEVWTMSFRVESTTHQYGRIEVVPRNTDELELRLSIFMDDYENACRSLSSYEFGIHHVQELRFVLERVLNRIQLGVEKWDQTGPLAVNASTPNAKLGYDWPLIKL